MKNEEEDGQEVGGEEAGQVDGFEGDFVGQSGGELGGVVGGVVVADDEFPIDGGICGFGEGLFYFFGRFTEDFSLL